MIWAVIVCVIAVCDTKERISHGTVVMGLGTDRCLLCRVLFIDAKVPQ